MQLIKRVSELLEQLFCASHVEIDMEILLRLARWLMSPTNHTICLSVRKHAIGLGIMSDKFSTVGETQVQPQSHPELMVSVPPLVITTWMLTVAVPRVRYPRRPHHNYLFLQLKQIAHDSLSTIFIITDLAHSIHVTTRPYLNAWTTHENQWGSPGWACCPSHTCTRPTSLARWGQGLTRMSDWVFWSRCLLVSQSHDATGWWFVRNRMTSLVAQLTSKHLMHMRQGKHTTLCLLFNKLHQFPMERRRQSLMLGMAIVKGPSPVHFHYTMG